MLLRDQRATSQWKAGGHLCRALSSEYRASPLCLRGQHFVELQHVALAFVRLPRGPQWVFHKGVIQGTRLDLLLGLVVTPAEAPEAREPGTWAGFRVLGSKGYLAGFRRRS